MQLQHQQKHVGSKERLLPKGIRVNDCFFCLQIYFFAILAYSGLDRRCRDKSPAFVRGGDSKGVVFPVIPV